MALMPDVPGDKFVADSAVGNITYQATQVLGFAARDRDRQPRPAQDARHRRGNVGLTAAIMLAISWTHPRVQLIQAQQAEA